MAQAVVTGTVGGFVGRRGHGQVLPALRWRRRFVRRLLWGDTAILAAGAAASAAFTGTRGGGVEVVALMLLWWGMLVAFRTRALDRIGCGASEYKRVLDAAAFTAGATAVVGLLLDLDDARWFLLATVPAVAGGLIAHRYIARRWLTSRARAGHHLSDVVVVGPSSDVAFITSQLGKHGAGAYHVVGGVESPGTAGAGPYGGTAKGQDAAVALLERVPREVRAASADAVVIAGPLPGGSQTVRELCWRLEPTGTHVIVVSSLTNVAGPRVRMRPVGGLPMMHIDLPSFQGGHVVLKRTLDVLGALAALAALAPVFAVLACLIKLDSKGPVFYSQERVGQGHRRFRMFKFRSMVVDAEARLAALVPANEGNGMLFKMREDPRVTRVGRWIRKHSFDELPQFLNVLRGEMSLVGPRPPLPREVEAYAGHTGRRLYIKPGLTGLWQISGRSDLDEEESVWLDLYYVENWSLMGDLVIMWRTLRVMINGSGAY